jgi:hypothetical protein
MTIRERLEMDGYAECCGKCGPGLCYVDQMTGEADEGWGWQR